MKELKLAVIVAMIDPIRTKSYYETWRKQSTLKTPWQSIVVVNSPDVTDDSIEKIPGLHRNGTSGDLIIKMKGIAGVVPAYIKGVTAALESGADIIACLHDDLAILEPGWDSAVVNLFSKNKKVGLACFSGAMGLGAENIYSIPYEKSQLARVDFISNMKEAEAHGRRVIYPCEVACGDGFSQIGRADFFKYAWEELAKSGITHHFYDSALGCLAKRFGSKVWYLPIECHHAGGLTGVGNINYTHWAKTITKDGDLGFHREAHAWGYEEFRDVLPIRIKSSEEETQLIND